MVKEKPAYPHMHYVSAIPRTLPAGRVLVHNFVRPQPVLGLNGFRAWLEAPSELLERCDCPWAPRLDAHYRVRRS